MAQATAVKKNILFAAPAKVKSVTIELTHDEAEQLSALVGRGAGLIDSLFFKLDAQGITPGRYGIDLSNGNIKVVKG